MFRYLKVVRKKRGLINSLTKQFYQRPSVCNKKQKNMDGKLVLVTGGSGFIAGHCIIQLLEAGYAVRTTVRSLKREGDVRAMLKTGGAEPGDKLSFFAADLTSDAGWAEAVAGCDYVLHVASPFPAAAPKDENELIIPAREGALRVLRASRDAGVKRVVLTSSFAAIGYGHPLADRLFTEKDWSNLNGTPMGAYAKSKTIAEKAAWDFMAREGGALELSVVNPVGVFGPVLGADHSTSTEIIQRLLNGFPGIPNLSFGLVDVRDVADLHIRAMTNPAAKGERFLAVAGESMAFIDIARLLKAKMPDVAKKVPTRQIPDWIIRIGARFDSSMGLILPELSKVKSASNEKARRVLGWKPRTNEEAVLATAESLVRLGLVKK